MLDGLSELAGDGFQMLGWSFLESAAEEFLAQGGQFSKKIGKLVIGGSENLLGGALLSNVDVGFAAGLAAPFDEGGLGDAQLAPDAGEAEASKAETEESATGGEGMHGPWRGLIKLNELTELNGLNQWSGFFIFRSFRRGKRKNL
jgi:hypothetical protein